MEEISWLMPLLILPGVGLLLMSTSIRYAQIHNEIHHLMDGGHRVMEITEAHLRQRAVLFRNALVGLYISAGAFAIGSISGVIIDVLTGDSELIVIAVACVGIASLVFSAIELIRESILSLEIITDHLDTLMHRDHHNHHSSHNDADVTEATNKEPHP
ncbi:MAG: DUF2721 domain-containing protein [Chloroflexi bacterium]|nr:DUF2721 domain-containing protein [Chloroflexota bacterium]